MRSAVINGTLVENTIIADETFTLPGRVIVTIPDDSPVSTGWTYSNEEFAPPPEIPVVVVAVTMRQARLALLYAGLLGPIETAMDALPEPHRSAAKIEWEFAKELRRDHPLVATLAAALELTEQDIDTLFQEAALIA